MSIFQHFLAPLVVSSFGFFKEKSSPLPHPCLTLAFGPPTHTHMLFGTLCPSLPGTTENEKSSERENRVFPGQESFGVFPPHFCSRLLVGVKSFVESLLLPPFPLSSQSPPAVLEGSPAFPSLPMHSGALTARDQGPWNNFPLASSLL